jgi:hypothetical protein
MQFFRERLLDADGLPRGFAGGKVSLDPQNVAQCVLTLLIAGGTADDRAAARHVWDEAARRGRAPLAPQRGYASLRWSVGPGVLAAAWLMRSS